MRLPNTLLASLLLVLPAAWAQNVVYNGYCANDTTQGTYSGTCTGWITPAPNAPLTQFSALFTVVTDSNGNVSGGGKASIGGTIVDQGVTGKSSTSANCTGAVSYDQKINGQPAPKLNIVFNVLAKGDEINGMSVDPGTVLVCILRRTNR